MKEKKKKKKSQNNYRIDKEIPKAQRKEKLLN